MKYYFIINPAAGTSDCSNAVKKLAAQCFNVNDCIFYKTTCPGNAREYVAETCKNAKTPITFFACGGDGTLNEVCSGAVGHFGVRVGCLPFGSGNDFIKYYGTKEDFLNADKIKSAVVDKIDLFKIANRYCVNVTNFGFDTTVARTMIKVKNNKIIGGKNAYKYGVFTAVMKAMKNACIVEADGKVLNPTGKLLLCTLANGRYVGGSFKCAPRSDNSDGLIEVCLINPISRFRFIKLLGPYTAGEHLDNPKFADCIIYCRASSVYITAPKGFAYSLDGEIIESMDFSVTVEPKAIEFLHI